MKSRYYTPTIEEFHVGFEYEWKESEEIEWKKEVSPVLISSEGYEDQKYGIRVKYLDKEDIESLGFKQTGKAVDDWYVMEKSIRLASGHWFHKFIIQHDRDNSFRNEEEDHNYNIKIYAEFGGEKDIFFEGIIKNKSELKKLLTQLGIKYES